MIFSFVEVLARFILTILFSSFLSADGLSDLLFEIKSNNYLSAFYCSALDEIDLSHLTEVSDERLYENRNDLCVLKLNGLKSFSPRQARILAEQRGFLHLDGLTELDEPLVDELSKCQCVFLSLNGIKKISPKSLKKLSTDNNGLISLGSISVDELRKLQDFFLDPDMTSCVILDGVESLPLDVAKFFINYHGGIFLNKLRRIDDEVLVALAKSEAHFMFDSLDTITDAQAEILSAFKQPVSLTGLNKVTDRQFSWFCKSEKQVNLSGLEELSDRQLQLLSGAKNPVKFKNLRSLPREIVRHYKGTNPSNHTLDFPLVRALDDDQARELSSYVGVIKLNGLKKISRKQASYLGATKGELQLNGLDSLSPGCAKQLFNQKGSIFLNGLSKIDDEWSVYLKNHFGPILLDGVTSITDKNARHLSAHVGTLSLAKLPSITDVQMDFLAKKKTSGCADYNSDQIKEVFSLEFIPDGDCCLGRSSLILTGLKSLSPEQSESLSKSSYNLELNGVAKLTAKQARDFLQLNNNLFLDGLTEIDDETLGVLFQRTSCTSLGGIKKISLDHARTLADRDSDDFDRLILSGVINLSFKHCSILGSKKTAGITLGAYAIDDECRKALKGNSGIFLGCHAISNP